MSFDEKLLKDKGFIWDGKQWMKPNERTSKYDQQPIIQAIVKARAPKEQIQTNNFSIPKSYFQEPDLIKFLVDPMGKPRMTQSDKWRKRLVTDRYWRYKAQIKKQADAVEFKIPSCNVHIIFNVPMPKTWSKKKKIKMNGNPHQQKPDRDNMDKGLSDALCEEDSHLWDARITKLWAYKGSISIFKL